MHIDIKMKISMDNRIKKLTSVILDTSINISISIRMNTSGTQLLRTGMAVLLSRASDQFAGLCE